MMKAPILTVGILSYNRARSLQTTLLEVCRQIGQDELNVEVVISDNASTDASVAAVGRTFEQNNDFVRYTRNSTNVGFDRNVCAVVKKASGQFCWILPDHDFVEKGTLKKLVDVLNSHPHVGHVFVNYAIYHPDFETFRSPSACHETKSQLVRNGNEYYGKTRFANSFVGSNVFQRDLFLNLDTEKYVRSGWMHFHVARDILRERSSYIMADHCLRMANDSFYERRAKIHESYAYKGDYCVNMHLNFIDFVLSLPKFGYSPSLVKLGMHIARADNMNQIAMFKLTTKNNVRNSIYIANQMLRYFYKYPSFWLVDLPVLFMPKILFRVRFKVGPIFGRLCRRAWHSMKSSLAINWRRESP